MNSGYVDTLPDYNATLKYIAGVMQLAIDIVKQLDHKAGFWDEEIDFYLKGADKAAIETALLILIAARTENLPGEHKGLLRDLGEGLAPKCRNERNRALLVRFPRSAAAFGIAQVAFNEIDMPDADFERLIRKAFDSNMIESVERLPYRSMDVRWLRKLLTEDHQIKFDDIIPNSVLKNLPHPIHITSTAETYALTHSLMYLSDFGRNALPPSLDSERLADTIDACIAVNILTENLDLLGELLICEVIIRRHWTPHARFAWRALCKTWDEFGFLPSPTFEISQFKLLSGADKTHYAMRHTYHTTYVFGILCAMLAQYPASVEADVPRQSYDHLSDSLISDFRSARLLAGEFISGASGDSAYSKRGYSDRESVIDSSEAHANAVVRRSDKGWFKAHLINRLLQYSGHCGSPDALWSRVLNDSAFTDDEVFMILGDGLITLACRDYNLLALIETLADMARYDLSRSFTFREGAKFLIYQQTESGAIGIAFAIEQNLRGSEALIIMKEFYKYLELIECALMADTVSYNLAEKKRNV